MHVKFLGSVVIGLMLFAGCQKNADKKDENTNGQNEKAAAEQQMPGQLNQTGDIEVSDKELQQFVQAVRQIQSLNISAQQEMSKAVQDEGMKTKRFREIQKSQQSQQKGQANASPEEMKKYQRIMKKIKELQSGMQGDMEKAIKETGLTTKRYQQIAGAARKDSTLMKRIQNAMKAGMKKQKQ